MRPVRCSLRAILFSNREAHPLQETYWRIPSSLHFETLRKRREIISKAVNGELVVAAADEHRQAAESSSDDDLFANLRRMRDGAATQRGGSPKKSRKRSREAASDSDGGPGLRAIREDDEHRPSVSPATLGGECDPASC